MALALLPLAALTTSNTLAAQEPVARQAKIEPAKRSVPYGKTVKLRGTFPGAAKQAVKVRYRAQGSKRWRDSGRTTTNRKGRYELRVKPRRSGYWRADLLGTPELRSSLVGGDQTRPTLDRGTDSKRISVRSKTSAKVKKRHVLAGERTKVVGKVKPAGSNRRVVVRIGGKKKTTKVGRSGRFSLSWRAPSTGRYPVRVKARSNRDATGSKDRAGSVTAYRKAAASWYGPGLYGNPLGCGGTLTPGTLGVAHKSLPCGTRLTLRYGGRSVRVRVIDRGPYSGHREFDLTAATKQRLGFPDLGTVLTSR